MSVAASFLSGLTEAMMHDASRHNTPNHWRGIWMLADTVQRMHGIATDSSTIVVRSRPDICFRDCFDFTNAAKVRMFISALTSLKK